jgi:hypothetical protein
MNPTYSDNLFGWILLSDDNVLLLVSIDWCAVLVKWF